MKKTKINLIIIAVIGIYLIFAKIADIRICLIYNIFHIPCPSCGLTRAYYALLQGDIISSLKYNILAIPIVIVFLLYFVFCLKDDINKTNKVEEFFKKYKFIIIFLTVILVIVNWCINLQRNI